MLPGNGGCYRGTGGVTGRGQSVMMLELFFFFLFLCFILSLLFNYKSIMFELESVLIIIKCKTKNSPITG